MKVLIHNLGDDTRSDAFIELNNDEDDFWGILFNPQPQKTLRKLTMQFYKKSEAFVELFFTDTKGNVAIQEPYASYVHMVPETTPFTKEQQEYLNDVKPVLANVGKEIFKNFLWISAIISPLLIYDVFPKVQPQKLNTWMGKLYFRKICKHIHEIGLRSSDNLTYFVKNTENLALPLEDDKIVNTTNIDDSKVTSLKIPLQNVFYKLENEIHTITNQRFEGVECGVMVIFENCESYMQDIRVRKYIDDNNSKLLVKPTLQYFKVFKEKQKRIGKFIQFFKGYNFVETTYSNALRVFFNTDSYLKYQNWTKNDNFLKGMRLVDFLTDFHSLKVLLKYTLSNFILRVSKTTVGECSPDSNEDELQEVNDFNFIDFSNVNFGRFSEFQRRPDFDRLTTQFNEIFNQKPDDNLFFSQYYDQRYVAKIIFKKLEELGVRKKEKEKPPSFVEEKCNCLHDNFTPEKEWCKPTMVLTESTTRDNLKENVKRCYLKWHPDKTGNKIENAAAKLSLIQTSKEFILKSLNQPELPVAQAPPHSNPVPLAIESQFADVD